MQTATKGCVVLFGSSLVGCASIDFGDPEGLTYYEPVPYVLITKSTDCKSVTATPLVLPGKRLHLKFRPGIGSSKLTVGLSNGMITSIGQESDNQIPSLLTAVTGLASTVGTMGGGNPLADCGKAKLYQVGVKEPVIIESLTGAQESPAPPQ